MRSTFPIENSVLLMQFRQFCSELMRVRRMLELLDPLSAPNQTPPGPAGSSFQDLNFQDPGQDSGFQDPDSATGPATVSQEPQWRPPAPAEDARLSLLALLEQQLRQSSDLGGALGLGLYREAEYVMAALADETLLNARWVGRHRWLLLEQEIFHTHASGDLFFQKLDRLLAGSSANSNDLAMIYFQALALGFRGRYRDADPQGHLERYRRQLYFRIFRTSPDEDTRSPIFLETYNETAGDSEGRRLPSPHLWWAVLAGVCAVWIFASTLLWHGITSDIRQEIEQIQRSAHSQEIVSR